MAQNTADQPSTEAAKPNTGGESPQAPTKPRVDPIAEAKLLELYYDFINQHVGRPTMVPPLQNNRVRGGERIVLGVSAQDFWRGTRGESHERSPRTKAQEVTLLPFMSMLICGELLLSVQLPYGFTSSLLRRDPVPVHSF
ncbi:hypothetical protein CEP52_004847 [Fusarium oligoseptatum]|uniref:Uncharacterized protein n=1 Tax=Fusarium oligoseptatum TaxID=2604345 RepID=A0A428U1N8_9HYPO|nr:hypothetical protein CEP52_004847 [Fusarium oligoseptatum]